MSEFIPRCGGRVCAQTARRNWCPRWRWLSAGASALIITTSSASAWHFTDVTQEAGVAVRHGYPDTEFSQGGLFGGGVAAGDYDGDGWIDLYVVRGSLGPSVLLRNRRDGRFEEVGAAAGVALDGPFNVGPIFADYDGDGRLDLLVLGVDGTRPSLLRNRGDGTFQDVTATSGLNVSRDTFSAAFGDYDRDGDLDLALTHWLSAGDTEILWRNNGDGTFTDVSVAAQISSVRGTAWGFAPNFADLNSDGWPDLLIAADYGTSRVFLNHRDGTFVDATSDVISDENGMGAAIGDYDNDGDLDWFVSSIWGEQTIPQGDWKISGNRMYRNRGDGTLEDVTDTTGVRVGYWGWGSTFADLNNDGYLDLYHVNGYAPAELVPFAVEFAQDPARLFVGNAQGTFTERATELHADDHDLGRGVVAFDYDRDGDLDLFIQNNLGTARLLRNDGENQNHFLTVRLRGHAANSEAVGARVYVTAGGRTQMRELRAGSNFESQDPAEAHFGLAAAELVDTVRVVWPDETMTNLSTITVDRFIVVTQPQPDGPTCTAAATANPCLLGNSRGVSACSVEFQVAGRSNTAMAATHGRVTCTEGDATCDFDPDVSNGTCVFRLAVCLNNTDARLPACRPSDVVQLSVRGPRATRVTDRADEMNRAAIDRLTTDAPGGFGLASRHDIAPVFANHTPNLCSAPVDIAVPLRSGSSGVPRSGRKVLRMRAQTTNGQRDTDAIKLECRPSS